MKVFIHLCSFIIWAMLLPEQLHAQNARMDSLTQVLAITSSDTVRIKTLNVLSELWMFDFDSLEKSKAMAMEALQLAQKNAPVKDSAMQYFLKKQMSDSYNLLGLYYRHLQQHEQALDQFFLSLRLREEINHKKNMAGAINNIASIYRQTGEYSNALDYAIKALKINEEIGNKSWVARNYTVIGNIYLDMGNYTESMQAHDQALKLFTELKDLRGISTGHISKGICYDHLKNSGEAEKCYLQALGISVIRPVDKYVALNGLAKILIGKGLPDSALPYLTEALDIIKKSESKYGYESVHINLGKIYTIKKDYPLAEQYLLEGLRYSEEIKSSQSVKNCLEYLYGCAYARGDYKKAIEYQDRYMQLKDSLLGEEKTIAVNEIKIRYETEKKDREISLLGNEKELQRLKIFQQQQALAVRQAEAEKKEAGMQLLEQRTLLSELKSQQLNATIEKQKLQNEKVSVENQSLKSEQLLQQANLSRQTLLRNSALLFSILVLFIGYLYYKRFSANKKYSLVLEEKNKIIQLEKERAVRSEKFKTEFLTNMSHEIRTPLHAIIGMINVLSQRNPREDQGTYLNVMRKSSENLIGIVNNVLDLSKIEAGKIEFEKIPFSPSDTIGSVVNLLHAQAADKGLSLKASCNNMPEQVIGDQVRLMQVLVNLVGNAIKFTGEGEVTISAESLPSSADQNKNCILRFRVADTGVGISKEHLDKIFESFTQAEEGITRRYGGTGLGLTISRQLIRLQGGTIEVKSEPGKGSVFTFSIPYMTKDKEAPVKNKVNAFRSDPLHGSRILIVEDNPYNQLVAIETLQILFKNLTIDTAENGLAALDKISAGKYDFVFMDLQMPEMDGYTAMKKIRETMPGKLQESFFIAISANASAGEKEKCLAAGMHDYLSKPFNPDELARLMISLKEKHVG